MTKTETAFFGIGSHKGLVLVSSEYIKYKQLHLQHLHDTTSDKVTRYKAELTFVKRTLLSPRNDMQECV